MKNTFKLLFPFLALFILVTPAWSVTVTEVNPTDPATFAPMLKNVFDQPAVTLIFVARGGAGFLKVRMENPRRGGRGRR